MLAEIPALTPDVGAPGEDALLPDPGGIDDPVAALMAQVAFEEQDVRDTLCEFFDWLAVKFESEHWSLTDRQARMLGRPTAQLANSLWVRIQEFLPDVLARWCESTPGALGFLTAAGLIVTPKIMQQIKISRERRAKRTMLERDQRPQGMPQAPAPVPAKPKSGIIIDEGGVA